MDGRRTAFLARVPDHSPAIPTLTRTFYYPTLRRYYLLYVSCPYLSCYYPQFGYSTHTTHATHTTPHTTPTVSYCRGGYGRTRTPFPPLHLPRPHPQPPTPGHTRAATATTPFPLAPPHPLCLRDTPPPGTLHAHAHAPPPQFGPLTSHRPFPLCLTFPFQTYETGSFLIQVVLVCESGGWTVVLFWYDILTTCLVFGRTGWTRVLLLGLCVLCIFGDIGCCCGKAGRLYCILYIVSLSLILFSVNSPNPLVAQPRSSNGARALPPPPPYLATTFYHENFPHPTLPHHTTSFCGHVAWWWACLEGKGTFSTVFMARDGRWRRTGGLWADRDRTALWGWGTSQRPMVCSLPQPHPPCTAPY